MAPKLILCTAFVLAFASVRCQTDTCCSKRLEHRLRLAPTLLWYLPMQHQRTYGELDTFRGTVGRSWRAQLGYSLRIGRSVIGLEFSFLRRKYAFTNDLAPEDLPENVRFDVFYPSPLYILNPSWKGSIQYEYVLVERKRFYGAAVIGLGVEYQRPITFIFREGARDDSGERVILSEGLMFVNLQEEVGINFQLGVTASYALGKKRNFGPYVQAMFDLGTYEPMHGTYELLPGQPNASGGTIRSQNSYLSLSAGLFLSLGNK